MLQLAHLFGRVRFFNRFLYLSSGVAVATILTPAIAAYAQAVTSYSIPAGSLDSALTKFGAVSGVQVLYSSSITSGLRTSGAKGSLTPEAGLSKLLAGTGLSFKFTGPSKVTISGFGAAGKAGDTEGATALAPITVNGTGDGTNGYVATQSAAGTKTNTPIIETPQAISVVTRKQMDAQGAQSVAQALDYSSGVVAEQRGVNMSGFEYLSGRGFQMEKYLDGLRLPNVQYNVPSYEPFDLDRIEVLHGPASVLYGQTFPGGLVNLVSKKPTEDSFGEVQATFGSHNYAGTAFDFGGPAPSTDAFLYRLTGTFKNSDTQIDDTKERRFSIAPAFTWQPDADTSLTLLSSYQDDPEAGYYNFVPAVGTVLPNPNGKISSSLNTGEPDFDQHSREQFNIGYQFEHHFDDTWTVRSNLRYTHIRDDFQNVFANGFAADNTTLNRYSFFNDETLGQFTTDNQVEADFDTGVLAHKAVAGLDYQRVSYNTLYGSDFFTVPGLNAFNPSYGADISRPDATGSDDAVMNQLGFYAQDQMSLDKWRFMISGRQDWTNSRDYDRINDTNTRQSDQAFTWRTGLVYLFDNGFAPYASYSTSFQPQIGQSYSGAAFKPTKGEQYEVGLKYQPTGYNSFATVSLFNLTQQNVLTADPLHDFFSVQTGEIRSRGAEVELHASLTDNLDLVTAYTYLDNVVTKANETDSAYDIDVGKHPTGIPNNAASLWANYTFDNGPLSGLSLGAGVRYVGWSYGTNNNTWGLAGYENTRSKVPSYTLFDASIKYDFGAQNPKLKGLQLALTGRNLFNRDYIAYCQSANACQFGTGRTVLGTLSYRW
ncbi:MAG: TonB-dependent siderophore receptor [Rhizobiaceae bacterium]|nr:TonB-dependent siderophore receptor [Rhizobiaceae bacterium]